MNLFRSGWVLLPLFVFLFNILSAQNDTVSDRFRFPCHTADGAIWPEKGEYYIAFGYNKNWYSKTNLHFFDESGDYDFTLHKMVAHDRPQIKDIFRVAISIPQYGYRMGYFFPRSKWGAELNFDHAKYIVDNYQTVRLTGRIGEHTFDKDTLVDPDRFMHLEHTDGANFLLANAMRRWMLYASPDRKFRVTALTKAGIGIVIPRSDVTLWGERNNHCFHIAGQIIGMESGFRAQYAFGPAFLFIEPTAKASFANFNKVLGVGDGLVSHRFGTASVLLHGGIGFFMGKKD